MSTTALPTSQDARHGLGRQLRLYASTFARNKSAMLGLVIVVGFLLVALFAPWLAPYPEDAAGSIKLAQKLLPPSSAHWFGTDEMGNDVFSRVILGARTSLQIGLTITVIAALIGVPLGVIAGYFGGACRNASCASPTSSCRCPDWCWPSRSSARWGPASSTP